eukprot:568339-Prymnesium_polylepis.2
MVLSPLRSSILKILSKIGCEQNRHLVMAAGSMCAGTATGGENRVATCGIDVFTNWTHLKRFAITHQLILIGR